MGRPKIRTVDLRNVSRQELLKLGVPARFAFKHRETKAFWPTLTLTVQACKLITADGNVIRATKDDFIIRLGTNPDVYQHLPNREYTHQITAEAVHVCFPAF